MRRLKKVLSLVIITIMTIFIISCDGARENSSTRVSNDELKVHYIDVGQADSILIQQGSESMLIDAGNNDDENTLKNYLNNLGITEFNYVVGTHPHEDHIGSLDYIMNSFKVGKIYCPKTTSTTKTFENLVNATKDKGLQFTTPSVGEVFNLGGAKCTILGPNETSYESLNNYSIVIKVEFGNNSFLFTGDAEKISEKEILANKVNLKCDVLKVGHHGSSSSTTQEFLNTVNPKYAIISSGKDNDYGHPHSETLTKLNAKGVIVYRTDEMGTIVATSDGNNIIFNSDIDFTDNTQITTINTQNKDDNNNSEMVWISSDKAKVFHRDEACSGMKHPRQITLKEAGRKELKPCSKCK